MTNNMFRTAPSAVDVSIVSDEDWRDLQALLEALERRGLVSEVITGPGLATTARCGVRYIRELDPTLTNLSYVAKSLSRPGRSADVNPPRSVRLTEWAPLANHVLRRTEVPQARRVWCIEAEEVKRTAEAFGLPVVIQAVASRASVLAATSSDVESAAQTVEAGNAPYGVLVEQPLAGPCSSVDVLVVARRAAGFAFGGGNESYRVDARELERVAVRAIDALGGDIMAVAIAIDSEGDAYVREVDAKPALSRFGRHACQSVANEIAARVARAQAQRNARRSRLGRHDEAPAALETAFAAGT